MSFIIPNTWPTGSSLQDFLLTHLKLARAFCLTVSLSFHFYRDTLLMSRAKRKMSFGLRSWQTYVCHEAASQQIVISPFICESVNSGRCHRVGLQVIYSEMQPAKWFRSHWLWAMKMNLHSTANGHGQEQTLLTDGRSCELTEVCNQNTLGTTDRQLRALYVGTQRARLLQQD